MTADKILKKHEDENEYHLHEVDRKWVIAAMEEYAALRLRQYILNDPHNSQQHSHFKFTEEESEMITLNKKVIKGSAVYESPASDQYPHRCDCPNCSATNNMVIPKGETINSFNPKLL